MWNGLIPVNTFVGMGTKTQNTYRTLSNSCSLYARTNVAVENGPFIHVLLHSRHGGDLSAGQDVDFLDICQKTAKPYMLAVDGTHVVWRPVLAIPAGKGTWTVETGHAHGTPIDILQSVRLVLTSNPKVHIVIDADSPTLQVSDDVERMVRFYFTNPSSISLKSVPEWVSLHYPDYRTHQQWLLTRTQTTPVHAHNHRKWHVAAPKREVPKYATYAHPPTHALAPVAAAPSVRRRYHLVHAALGPSAAF